MSLYNMLFGNALSDIYLALLGLKSVDIERFRDCFIDFREQQIQILTRTGGDNRAYFPNKVLVNHPDYLYDEDGRYDSTYATYYFKFPENLTNEILCLSNIEEYGIPAKLIKHIASVQNREPTVEDQEEKSRTQEKKVVRRLKSANEMLILNGHTLVPLSDYAMATLLEVMEDNNGELVYYHNLLPIKVNVFRNCPSYLMKSDKPLLEQSLMVVYISADSNWTIDDYWWERWQKKYAEKYPLAMLSVEDMVKRHMRSL